jgi:hypothetical protein
MPTFVVKATLKDRDLLPPITATAYDEKSALALVRSCLSAHDIDRIEGKGLRDDVMRAAFGDQPEGAVVIRSDWMWSGETPVRKDETAGGKSIDTVPRDGREIMIYGSFDPGGTRREWIRGRYFESSGWYSGPDSALVPIHAVSLWKPI